MDIKALVRKAGPAALFLAFWAVLIFLKKEPTPRLDPSETALSAGSVKALGEARPPASGPRVARAPLPPVDPPSRVTWTLPAAEPPFAKFTDWFSRYSTSEAETREQLEKEGIELARERRVELRRLIQADPKQALELAVPVGVRRALPHSITSLLEKRVSGRGTLAVFGALPERGRENEVALTFRRAQLENLEYQAYVYGRRLGEPTRAHLPLNGIAVDNLLAIHESPARILEPEEIADLNVAASEALCAVSGQPATIDGEQTAVEVGGEVVFLCGKIHADDLNKRLIAAEAQDTLGISSVSGEQSISSTYTEGQKKLLVIRVDFSDLAGSTIASNSAVSLISSLGSFYAESSYGKTGFFLAGAGSAVTPVLRMPRTAADYGGSDDFTGLRSDARSAAAAAGFVLAQYQFDLICMGAVPGFGWAGLGYVGAPGAWLHNSFSAGVAGHELGHNYGLNHASFWDTAGQSIIGSGTHVEYGDSFDTMGAASAGNNHFNARYKNYLNWLTPADRVNVTSNGTYRIYAHDDASATGLRGLRIVRSSTTNYWVELRQKFTSNKWLMNGVGLRWTGNGNEHSHLLDTTPGSPNGLTDSALVIGRTFSDLGANVHITPIRKGGTTPESMDVTVNLGPFPTNLPPVLAVIASSATVSAGAVVDFSTSALDPNGDALAYYWDFGDGNFGPNSPAVSYHWNIAGEYLVQCTATDMKGGLAIASALVRVGSPATFRISGQVKSDGLPLPGVRIYVSSSKMTYTDSDGSYTLAGLSAGAYTVSASLDGYVFIPIFANPVRMGPSATDIDFFGASSAGQSATLVSIGSVWKYLDKGSNQGSNWSKPDFTDLSWKEGRAQLGYGDADEATTVSFGSNPNNKFITTYFRHRFTVGDLALNTNLTVNILRDDGAVVYLNGVEIFRSNMPATGTIGFNTLASSTVSGANESVFSSGPVNASLLRVGENVLAVEIHQSSVTSSDISFDLELKGALYQPPLVVIASPREGAIFPASSSFLLQANTSDFDGTVRKVEFFADGQKLGEDLASPFSLSWGRAELGRVTLTAVATDNDGLSSTSAPVTVTFETALVPPGSVWRFLDNGSNQRTSWFGVEFDASAWKSGPAELGYGDGPEATVVNFGTNPSSKFITTYFRQDFTVADPEQWASLSLGLLRDDGAVVYLNGGEILRMNMPAGAISYTTPASRAVDGVEETTYQLSSVDPGRLVPGRNVFAVEVHQASGASSDLSFDLFLTGARKPGSARPGLSWTRSGEDLLLSWPASASGWSLYSTDDLSPAIVWSPVNSLAILVEGRNVVAITPGTGRRFYTLRKP